MGFVFGVMLLAFEAYVGSTQAQAAHSSSVQNLDSVDELIDKLVGRGLKEQPIYRAGLESTTLEKGQKHLAPASRRLAMFSTGARSHSLSGRLPPVYPGASSAAIPHLPQHVHGHRKLLPPAAFLSDDEDASFKQKAVAGVVALLLAQACVDVVPSGEVGLATTFGKTAEMVLQPGLALHSPVTEVQTFSVKTQLLEEENFVPTKEGLNIELDTAVLYHLDPAKVPSLVLSVGGNYKDVIIEPEVRSIIRGLTSEQEAKALYTSGRTEIQAGLKTELSDQLRPRGIIVEDVLLKAVKLPDQLTKSIEAKAQAEQEAQRMEFVLQKEQQEAARKKIEAQGIADFQKIVSRGIDSQLLKWKGIEATEKLAESPNSKIVIMGNSEKSLPVILSDPTSK